MERVRVERVRVGRARTSGAKNSERERGIVNGSGARNSDRVVEGSREARSELD